MPQGYLVRYGRMRHIGRFAADAEADADRFDRGRQVVVRTCRGTELGEILAPCPLAGDEAASRTRILRIANTGDIHRARDSAARPSRIDDYQRLLDEAPMTPLLIEAEPLLDDGGIVLHYLGEPDLDVAALRDRLRATFGVVAVFEAAGWGPPVAADEPTSCDPGSCGSGGCGSVEGGPGCSSCAVKDLLARRRDRPARPDTYAV